MVGPAAKQDQQWPNAYVKQVLRVQLAVYVGFPHQLITEENKLFR